MINFCHRDALEKLLHVAKNEYIQFCRKRVTVRGKPVMELMSELQSTEIHRRKNTQARRSTLGRSEYLPINRHFITLVKAKTFPDRASANNTGIRASEMSIVRLLPLGES
jgi:hypothetical protein